MVCRRSICVSSGIALACLHRHTRRYPSAPCSASRSVRSPRVPAGDPSAERSRCGPRHRLGGRLWRGGQRLYVVPNLSLIVAVTAGLYANSNGGPPSVQENLAGNTVLNSFVLPAALAR